MAHDHEVARRIARGEPGVSGLGIAMQPSLGRMAAGTGIAAIARRQETDAGVRDLAPALRLSGETIAVAAEVKDYRLTLSWRQIPRHEGLTITGPQADDLDRRSGRIGRESARV